MKTLELAISTVLRGAGGGGSSAPRAPIESPDSLRSISYARILDLIGEGEIYGFSDQANPLSCVYLNETPVANADGSLNFKNIQVDSRVGTQVQDYIQGFDGVESEIGIGVELRSDVAWTRAITNLNLNALRVRLSVPALSKANTTNGDITGYRIAYRIELQTDGGSFVTKLDTAFSGKTSSKYERTHRIDLTTATTGWTLRVVRVTVNADSSAIQDTTIVESYAEIIDAKLRMPMSALVSVVVDAEQFNNIPSRAYRVKGRIIRVPSNYDPETRVYTGLWDGTFQPAWSNNPAWVFYDMALNTRYGLGHIVPENLVDKWTLYRIAQYCDTLVPDGLGGMEPRFTCNICFQAQNDALRVMQDLSTVFRGIIYATGNTITAVADMPEDAVYTYSPSNVLGGKFTYSGSSGKVRHTVALVSYTDMTDFGRAKVEYVDDPDGIARYGIQQTEIIAVGCSSRGQARRWGAYLLVTERYETDACSWGVGLDGTVVAPGKIVKVADPLRAGARTGGRISSATINSVNVDMMPAVAAGDTLVVILPNGTSEERTVLSTLGKTITVASDFSAIPVAQSQWAVESEELALQQFRILSVAELTGKEKGYGITAIQHVPGKFAFVDTGVMIEEPPIAPIPPQVVPSPTGLAVTSRDVIEQNTVTKVVNLSWNPVPVAVTYKAQWRMSDGSWVTVDKIGTANTDLIGVGAGTFEVQVIAIDVLGRMSVPTFGGPYTIDTVQSPPKYVNDINNQFVSINGELQVVSDAADQLRVDVDQAAANIQQEVTDRTDAINAEANARATAILNEQNTRSAAITAEQTTRQTADDSLATQISLVSAGSGEQFDSAKIWYFDVDLESWTGNGAPTIVDGWLRPANHATDPFVTSPTGIAIAGQSYRFAKMRIKKVGNPAWSGQLRWRLVGDAAGAWRGPVVLPLPSFDGNGVTAIAWEDIAWWPGTIDQVRMDLSTVQDASNYYLIDWIALGRPTPGAGVALVQDETTARVAADSAEATQRSTLATQMRGAYTGTDVAALTSGLLFSERTARVTADTAMASDISSLQASVGTNTAAITSEQTARANADSALSTRIDSVTATANAAATQASLSAEQTARANADGAMAADIALLGAHNAGKTAFILDQNKVQIDGTQTFAQMLTGLKTADTDLGARVDTEQTARIAGDSANATAITAVQAEVDTPFSPTIGWQFAGGLNNGFIAANAFLTSFPTNSNFSASVIFTGTTYTDPQFYSPAIYIRGVTAPYVRALVRNRGGGAWEGILLWSTTGHGFSASYQISAAAPTDWTWVEFNLSANADWLASIITGLRFDFGTGNNSTVDIRQIVIGDYGQGASAAATTALIANVGPSGAYAQATTMLDVNGRITGVSQTNNGTTGDFKILADKFSIESPAGGARTEYSTGNWRVYDSAGVLRVRMGIW